ncbi:hypothetical protein D477_011781, partial [Arthrobacter crystallopoietes BAB-32]
MSEQDKKPDGKASPTNPETDPGAGSGPDLGTGPEDLQLDEPKLGRAQVGEDAARQAELDGVAAETDAAAREAKQAGRLAGG